MAQEDFKQPSITFSGTTNSPKKVILVESRFYEYIIHGVQMTTEIRDTENSIAYTEVLINP